MRAKAERLLDEGKTNERCAARTDRNLAPRSRTAAHRGQHGPAQRCCGACDWWVVRESELMSPDLYVVLGGGSEAHRDRFRNAIEANALPHSPLTSVALSHIALCSLIIFQGTFPLCITASRYTSAPTSFSLPPFRHCSSLPCICDIHSSPAPPLASSSEKKNKYFKINKNHNSPKKSQSSDYQVSSSTSDCVRGSALQSEAHRFLVGPRVFPCQNS